MEPLLDVLVESEDRAVRRLVFDALSGMTAYGVVEEAVRRLSDDRWFVQRNMLALLRSFESLDDGVDLRAFGVHADYRVRRAAMPLIVKQPQYRHWGIEAALADEDEHVVRLALSELGDEPPEGVLPALIDGVLLREGRSTELRAAAAERLVGSSAPAVLSALLAVATSRRTVFGKVKLAPRTELVVAALSVLATSWADKPEAQELLERASRSRDAKLREAARSPTNDVPP